MTSFNRFSPGEIYHCYNRGVDKRITFDTTLDYKRFIQLLFLCNNKKLIQRSSLYNINHDDVFDIQKDNPLVSIGGYCLMPNHFHLLLQEIDEGGISLFMSRIGNSYTKYYNLKNNRNGNLFVKPFLSKHILSDQHYSHIVQYIHLNPAELFEPNWKTGKVANTDQLEISLTEYPYSSLRDYLGIKRPEQKLLDPTFVSSLSNELPSLKNILDEASEYYADIEQNS
ncbi:MAG: REP-associated tyrosine transposase [Patescibacteria group bacterium]|nr:REP-associated tyrosine transposase [Patescibacteria group bacterium]